MKSDKPILKLTIPEFVSVNHYKGMVNRGGKPSMFTTKEAKRLQKEVVLEVVRQTKAQNWITDLNPFQHYVVDADFYFPRIDMDCNNYWKVAFDAITDTQLVWADDNMVMERVQNVFYDNKNPRIELTIYKADCIGIFENTDKLNEFEGKCQTCTRHKRNCSLLIKAKEGRIQEEIVDNICSKYKEIKGE